jgi:hypothetical protein
MFSGKMTKAVMVVSSLLISGAVAHGAFEIVQFEPGPVSPNIPEFSWTGPGGNFVTGAGVVGNGDGNLPEAAQTPGGLELDSPLPVPGIPNSTIDVNNDTHFFDVTMTLSSDTVAADLHDTGGGVLAGSNAIQPLSSGTFTFVTTPSVVGQAPVVLLTGTLSQNALTVPEGSTSSGFQTATVTYTGGAILNALNGGTPITGSASISLVSLDGPIVINQGAAIFGNIFEATINPFDANADGVFDVPNIPEPASVGILAAAGMLSMRRRRA